jgi:hypothetical protein
LWATRAMLQNDNAVSNLFAPNQLVKKLQHWHLTCLHTITSGKQFCKSQIQLNKTINNFCIHSTFVGETIQLI